MNIARIFAYSDNARRVLRETLAAHPEAFSAPFETISRYNTIRKIVAHTIGAEERWIVMRIEKHELPVIYEDRAGSTSDSIFDDWDMIRAGTRAFIARQTPETLATLLALTHGANDDPLSLTTEEVLFHIVNHENYHRGQIVMTLQRMGIDPPNFDYSYLYPKDTPDA